MKDGLFCVLSTKKKKEKKIHQTTEGKQKKNILKIIKEIQFWNMKEVKEKKTFFDKEIYKFCCFLKQGFGVIMFDVIYCSILISHMFPFCCYYCTFYPRSAFKIACIYVLRIPFRVLCCSLLFFYLLLYVYNF